MTTRSNLFRLAAFTLFASALPTHAQDIGGVFDMGGLTGTAAMDPVIEQSRDRAIRKGEKDPLPGRPGARAQPPMRTIFRSFADRKAEPIPAARASALTYAPSPARRKANFARFVERSRQQDPDGAAKLAAMFEKEDVIKAANDWMKPYGMATTNVADATAVYLTSAWLTAHGQTQDPSQATMRAVQQQVASAMIATPEFLSSGDTEKQELAEIMIVQAIMIAQFGELAAKTPTLMPAIKKAAAQGAANSLGIDLNALTMTEAGLR